MNGLGYIPQPSCTALHGRCTWSASAWTFSTIACRPIWDRILCTRSIVDFDIIWDHLLPRKYRQHKRCFIATSLSLTSACNWSSRHQTIMEHHRVDPQSCIRLLPLGIIWVAPWLLLHSELCEGSLKPTVFRPMITGRGLYNQILGIFILGAFW